MIYLKWFVLAIVDLLLMMSVPFFAPIIAIFTREKPYGQTEYTWGWLWGTYDNPPQGDEGYVAKRALFIGATTGLKGYVNRVMWMYRNPLYGVSKRFAVPYRTDYFYYVDGDTSISDKYKIPGSYLVKVFDKKGGNMVAFEYYLVKPWSDTKDLRVRIGWKVWTDKFAANGFAPLVVTCNPLDGYGND